MVNIKWTYIRLSSGPITQKKDGLIRVKHIQGFEGLVIYINLSNVYFKYKN